VTQDVTVGGGPQQVIGGPAGQLGYGAPSDSLGRIATDGTASPTTATGTDSFDVTFGRDGAYWYSQSVPDKVARLSTTGDYTQPISLPTGSFPRYLAADANNNIWVQAAMGTKAIYRIGGVEPAPSQTTDPGTGNTGNTGNTGDPGNNGNTTAPDTIAPLLSKAKVDTKKRRLAITLDEPAALQVVVQQKVKRGKKNVWKRIRPVIKKQGVAGLNTVALGKKFKKGSYRVQVTAVDAAGNKTAKPKTVGFKVKK